MTDFASGLFGFAGGAAQVPPALQSGAAALNPDTNFIEATGTGTVPDFTGGGGNTGGNTGGANAAAATPQPNPLVQEGISQEYGSAIQGGQNALAANEANYPLNLQLAQNIAQGAQQNAQGAADTQTGVYNTQKSGVQAQQALSLAQLADQIRGAGQGLQAQLGAQGAGSSSAVDMGRYGLAHQQNLSRASIQTQAGANIGNIEAQKQKVQTDVQNYIANVVTPYKAQQVQQIMQNYQQLHDQLTAQIGQASGEEKRQLGLFVQNLSQAAGDALVQLNNTVSGATQAFINQQNSIRSGAPAPYTPPALIGAPPDITVAPVSPFQMNAPTGAPSGSPTGGSLASLFRQQQQGALA